MDGGQAGVMLSTAEPPAAPRRRWGKRAALLGAADFSPRIFWGGSLIVLAALLAALAHHKE